MGKARKPNSIQVRGDDIPKPVQSFTQLFERYQLANHLRDAIKRSEFKSLTAVQTQVIPLMLDRREIVCSAPTGSGKTLAFVLPIVHQLGGPMRCGSFRAIILAPTKELAKQIHREALWIAQDSNLRIHLLSDIKEAARKFNPESLYKYDVLVTTPPKLASLLNGDKPAISLHKVEWLVIDECDKLFELGFKDDLSIIYTHCLSSDNCRRALFSATLQDSLVKWAEIQMDNLVTVIVGGKNKASSNVEQELLYVGNEQGRVLALRELILSGIETPALIFVETKEKAKQLSQEFMYENYRMDFIHSEREQKERDEVVKQFRLGNTWFLVCTDLMGRGIDFKGVNMVINYDCPKSYVSYIHRIGRTGRAGRHGKAVTLIVDEDKKVLPQMIRLLRRSGCEVPQSITTLLTKSKDKGKGKRKAEDRDGRIRKKRSKNKGRN